MELTEALVNSSTNATQGDDVGPRWLRFADPSDGLAKIGSILVGIMDDLSRDMLGGIEIVD
jgi:hypothetical protein